jgi:hypothetical protein
MAVSGQVFEIRISIESDLSAAKPAMFLLTDTRRQLNPAARI